MRKTDCMKWVCGLSVLVGLASCNLDMPQEVQTSFETLTVKKSDIEVPIKFSAKMKGQADVTITPQVGGHRPTQCSTESGGCTGKPAVGLGL